MTDRRVRRFWSLEPCSIIHHVQLNPHLRAMSPRLSDLEIQRALGSLPGWARRGEVLTKSFSFPTFADGIAFVQRAARAADEADHHPDIDIRYTKIVCTLSTHDAGGITAQDLALAHTIEALAQA